MGFSTKANTAQANGNTGGATEGGSSTTPEQWDAWNEYYEGLFSGDWKAATRKDGSVIEGKFFKKANLVGKLKFILDIGYQPQADSVYDSKAAAPKDGEEYSSEELEHLKKFPDNAFYWEEGKRKQSKPERPTQEYIFQYDFGKTMVDWTKHPLPNLQRLGLKPLRVSYNGSFSKGKDNIVLGKTLAFKPHYKTKKLSPNNPIMKIAASSGVASSFEQNEYDLGALVDSACKWNVFLEKREYEGKKYYQTVIKNHSEITEVEAGDMVITVEQQIPECPTEFMGILMNGGEYTDEMMENIVHKREMMAVLPRSTTFKPSPIKFPDFELGVSYEGSDLEKALTAYQTKSGSVKQEQPKKEVKKEAATVKKEEATPTQEPMEFDEEMDDTIPF